MGFSFSPILSAVGVSIIGCALLGCAGKPIVSITDVVALEQIGESGSKVKSPQTLETSFVWENPPLLDSRIAALAPIQMGGISGAILLGSNPVEWELLLITDRGPNGTVVPVVEGLGTNVRIFPIPSYSPELIRISLGRELKGFVVKARNTFKDRKGATISGLNYNLQTEENKDYTELAINLGGKIIARPKFSMDPEGLCVGALGDLWVVDEYGPSILHFDSKYRLIKKYSPGSGLPDFFKKRAPNRGFEGVFCRNDKVYAMLQSPLRGSTAKLGILLEFDTRALQATGIYFYPFDKSMDKVSEVAFKDGWVHFLELNGLAENLRDAKIYRIKLDEMKNVLPQINLKLAEGKNILESVELLKDQVASKSLFLDLKETAIGKQPKIESMVFLSDHQLLLISDNDFSIPLSLVHGKPVDWSSMIDNPVKTHFSLFEFPVDE